MFPPLLRLLLDEPRWLVSHASAYGELIAEDAGRWRAHQLRRLACVLSIVMSLVLALALAGVALMLHAVSGSSHWLLWGVPASPLLVTLGGLVASRTSARESRAFSRVRRQLAEDLALFDLKEPEHDSAPPSNRS